MKPSSGTLVIDISGDKAEAYEGVYQCTARNVHGTALSNNIVIRQPRSPLWSKERNEAIVVQVGGSLVLQCRPPAGLPPPNIFWMDNHFRRLSQDARVSQAINGDLYFSNILPEDTRSDYICYARFPHTRTIQQKQPINVKVIDDGPTGERRPTFMTPTGPSSTKMVLRGETLELECIAEGLPTPEMSWGKDNGDLPSDRMSLHNFQKTLHIVEVTEADAGDYRCSAQNSLGNAHHIIKVVVKASPFWISTPTDLILAPKETGILTCRAGGDPKPQLSWSVNGVPIANSPKDLRRKVEDDTVILSDVQTGSSAVYQCNVSNQFGYLLANILVNVLAEPPRVLTPPNNLYQVITNSRALLDCASFGSPIPTITWFKDSQTSILNDIHENGTLEIHGAQPLNSGKYTCIASNNLGTKENHVYLEVKEPTRILRQPEYKVVERNRVAVFECKVKHDPTLVPTMIWLKDNAELPADERFVLDVDTLTIRDVIEEDEGTYTCIRNTSLDQDSASAMLTVIEATPPPPIVYEQPDPPSDLELTEQRDRSVQLTWTPGDEHNSPTQKFLIQYEDLLHEPGVWTNLSEVDGGRTTAQLDLSPYAWYSFRVLAQNAVGYSLPSQPSRQYRTNPAAPEVNPSDVQGVGTEHDNLVISWKKLQGLQANGPGLMYKVQWRQQGVDQEWASETVHNVSQFVVSGTPTFVPYEVRVQAVNDNGDAPEPAVVLGHSGEDLPLTAPESVQVQAQNGTLAEVHWKPVTPISVRGRLQGYKVYYWRERSLHGEQEGVGKQQQVLTFSGNRSEGHLPGLQPYSVYGLSIRVLNGKGEGPASTNQTFETPEGVPGPPSYLKITNPNVDSLTLEWGPPQDNNGRLTGYTLKYQPVNNTNELGPVEELVFLANETSTTLSNLKYSTRYKFFFTAKTIKGSGPSISEETVIMDEALIQQPSLGGGKDLTEPPHPTSPITQPSLSPIHKVPPKGPTFSSVNTTVTEDGAGVSWEYSGAEKNVFVEYIVENSKEEWRKEFVNGSQSYLIKGLKPGTSYRVRVVARDQSGASIHSTEEHRITVPAIASRQVDIATQGWFIGLMCAIALLILVLLIVCFIKRNKGGKYPVKEKEDAHQDPEIQPMKEDDGTFGEYSDTEDHKPLKGSRTPSNGTVRRDESDDSLVDYGEGGDGQFNEDGSFIGQYSGRKEKDTHEGNESSEAPSPVNASNSFV
ncbi:neuronal cell adhesion molecule a isoform X9 [Osmerus eperlanus]